MFYTTTINTSNCSLTFKNCTTSTVSTRFHWNYVTTFVTFNVITHIWCNSRIKVFFFKFSAPINNINLLHKTANTKARTLIQRRRQNDLISTGFRILFKSTVLPNLTYHKQICTTSDYFRLYYHTFSRTHSNTKVFLSTISCLIQYRSLLIEHFDCACKN